MKLNSLTVQIIGWSAAVLVLFAVMDTFTSEVYQQDPTTMEGGKEMGTWSPTSENTGDYMEQKVIYGAETIVLGAGCFWGVEKAFENLNGVLQVTAGYAGGDNENPTYRNHPGHAEVVEVVYNPAVISTQMVIKFFWELHDPTNTNGQGNDRGPSYRSALYWTTEEQKQIAYDTRILYQMLLTDSGHSDIVTEMKSLEKFTVAEEYHQDYLVKNPNGYCPNHKTGVVFPAPETNSVAANVESEANEIDAVVRPLGGLEIIVVESTHYCPFCEQFKKDVSDDYRGSVPMRTVLESQLEGFEGVRGIFATPTIMFIKDGKVVETKKGYLSPEEFYPLLGEFIGGDAFEVGFEADTDRRFCREYDLFKDTPEGVFVDKFSGDPLFSTATRYDSGTGWLSFRTHVEDNVLYRNEHTGEFVTEIPTTRTYLEIVAKTSGSHLGHIFFNEDGAGQHRYCVNATVLEFVEA